MRLSLAFIVKFEDKGVYVKYAGKINYSAILSVDRSVVEDIRFKSIKYYIADFLAIDKIELEGTDFKISAFNSVQMSEWNRFLKLALIVNITDESLAYQWIEFVQSKGMHWDIKVFNEINTAREWAQIGDS